LTRFHSVRARLTILNVAVLAMVLILLGALLRFTLQETLLASVDNHLRQIVGPMRRQFAGPPPDRQGGPPIGGLGLPGPTGGAFGNGAPPAGSGPGQFLQDQSSPPQGQDRNPDQGPDNQQWSPGAHLSGQNTPPDQAPGPPVDGSRPHPPWDSQPTGGPSGAGSPGSPPARRFGPQRRQPRGDYPPHMFGTDGHMFGAPPGDASQPYDHALFVRSLAGVDQFGYTYANTVLLRVYSTPIYQQGRVVAVGQAVQPMTDVERDVDQLTRTLLLVSPLALLVAGLSGSLLASRALRPVKQLIKTTETIEATDLAGRIPVEGADEFAELSTTINNMFARLESSFAQQDEAIRQLRQFTADASHELRTPLTVIKANTSLALTGPDDSALYRIALQEADWAADRMNAIVQDLLLLARSDAGTIDLTLNTVAVADAIDQAVRLVAKADTAPIEVRPIAANLKILADREAIERLLGNLIKNAQRHTPPTGRITIAANSEQDSIRITVADSGEGIPPQHLPHVFERFYRVDSARSRERGGTGLGLPICKTIAESHGGTIEITSTVGIGTQVTVRLPSLIAATSG